LGHDLKALDDATLLDEAHKLCAHFAAAPTLGSR
jgi:hypothetical protein